MNRHCPFTVPNQSENGKYNLISVWPNKISKIFLCAKAIFPFPWNTKSKCFLKNLMESALRKLIQMGLLSVIFFYSHCFISLFAVLFFSVFYFHILTNFISIFAVVFFWIFNFINKFLSIFFFCLTSLISLFAVLLF